MMGTPLSIFISYSRTDGAFADRLEADLQARSFRTWVDRRKLEGGQNWMDELQKAIDRCHILLIVLSPEAVESQYVRMEYRYAQSLKKVIIPLEYRVCPKVPIDLNSLQWVNFKTAYEQGLSSLLATLSRITPATIIPPPAQALKTSLPPTTKEPDLVVPKPAPLPPDPDLTVLYRGGIIAKAEGDLERTAALWQQILDRDPNFGNKALATMMTQLQQELHPIRVQRLRERAQQAHQAGEWGQAIGAWQALLGLEPRDQDAKQWLPIAEKNQQYLWMYENTLQFAQEGQLAAAKLQLEMLWQMAPTYGDPARIAEKIGLPTPTTRLKQSYKGTYKGTNAGILEISVESWSAKSITAIITWDQKYKHPYQGTLDDNHIILSYCGPDKSITSNFEGDFFPDGHLEGTGTWYANNYTWTAS